MTKKTPIEQLRDLMKNRREEEILGGIIANLHPQSADQFCLMCVAYLRFKIRPVSQNAFLYGITVNFLNTIECMRRADSIQMAWGINPVLTLCAQVHSSKDYKELMYLDTTITIQDAEDFMKQSIGTL